MVSLFTLWSLSGKENETFKRQYHNMVKHAQTIRRQIVDELFECVWPFWGIGAWRVKHRISSPAFLDIDFFIEMGTWV